MGYLGVFRSYSTEEKIIAFAVMIQPLLVVLQFIMISVFFMPEAQTTKYRVILTALPMMAAILVGLKRKFLTFVICYSCLFLFMGVEYMLFPANGSYIFSDSFRFLVPIIIPSIICLSCLDSISLVEDVLYVYSWLIVVMILFFDLRFLQGRVDFQSYNMGLSYALLLPMVTLYKKYDLISYLGAIICFISILLFGSRGALVVGVLYIAYDMCQKNRRNLIIILIASFFIINIAILLGDYMESLGISSRTLNYIIGGEMSSAEGRDSIYENAMNLIRDNWFIGLGIYGDRVNMGSEYCHNFLLELWMDYGVILGSLIIMSVLIFLAILFKRMDPNRRNTLIKYTTILFLPFFMSSSYLIDCNFGVYWGIIMLLNNDVEWRSDEVAENAA